MREYLFDEYRATEDENYTCRDHREHFKQKLLGCAGTDDPAAGKADCF